MNIPENCHFYQTIDLPGLGTIPGSWDHRGTVDTYLGGVSLAGKTVLEVGPASGFFSFELERRGASVIALELGDDSDWDVVPHVHQDDAALRQALIGHVEKVRNAFAFTRSLLGSRVETVHGTVYDTPRLVGEVDVALIGNVLCHLRDPFLALTQVAQVVRDTIIVCESMWFETPEFRNIPAMYFIPRADMPEANHSWWQISPVLVAETLRILGFPRIRCAFHEQRFNGSPNDPGGRLVPHFTVTGARLAASPDVSVVFGPDWNPPEETGRHVRRWSKGSRAEVLLRSHGVSRVDVAFGLGCAAAGSEVSVRSGGREVWRRAVWGRCAVFVPEVTLTNGESVLELELTAPPPRPADSRLQLCDFTAAPA